MKWLWPTVGVGVAGIGLFYFLRSRNANEKVVLDPNETKVSDPLILELDLNASWLERTAASDSDLAKLQQDIFNIAVAVQNDMPTACPGAPALRGVPSVSLVAIDIGFRVTVKVSATWGSETHGDMRSNVAECIKRLVISKDADIGERLQSIRAYRA